MSYQETHYYRAWLYAVFALLAGTLVAGAIGLAWFVEALAAAVGLILTAAGVALVVVALGRLRVEVHGGALWLTYGWIPLIQRRLPIDDLTDVRACLLPRHRLAVGWGFTFRPDRARRYGMGVRRGVEFAYDGRLHIVATRRPAELKAALLRQPCEPRRRRRALTLSPRRRWKQANTWALIRPQDVRGFNKPLT